MSLVDYSDTGSESSLVEEETSHKEDVGPSKEFCGMKRRCSDDACLNLKRVRKSTLSDGFLSMEGSDTEDVSPNLKHGGRIRSIPHVRGNWPTFVYCTFQPPPDLINIVSDIIERAIHNVPTLKKVKLLENGLHISLSKTVYLKSFQIDRFSELLKKRCSILHRFEIGFNGITSYVNDEGTRSFLGLDIGYGHQQVRQAE
ncbi:poly(U)-specific 3'-to-5' RNA exonuclease [Gaertneriomyces sp. JEL0708]|nr:poly(U)-specific 3'-to-5' RNA exonuclease [Gaertneriomyces sp. JEL0708]